MILQEQIMELSGLKSIISLLVDCMGLIDLIRLYKWHILHGKILPKSIITNKRLPSICVEGSFEYTM